MRHLNNIKAYIASLSPKKRASWQAQLLAATGVTGWMIFLGLIAWPLALMVGAIAVPATSYNLWREATNLEPVV